MLSLVVFYMGCLCFNQYLYFYVVIVVLYLMGQRAEHACVEARVMKCSLYYHYYTIIPVVSAVGFVVVQSCT
jgi:hypothetical protein